MLSETTILTAPVDQLALRILRDFDESGQWNDYNYVNEARNAGHSREALNALSEAITWLHTRGLLAPDLTQHSSNAAFVTRLGRKSLDEGLDHFHATESLQKGLHQAVEPAARPQFLIGEYELGVFAALKAVEIRLRKLSKLGDDVHGVDLINRCFAQSGVLVDPDQPKGEQEGVRSLFAGAYAVLRNPAGHREVSYDDVIEAAEAVQTASLLMRMLDRIESRMAPDA